MNVSARIFTFGFLLLCSLGLVRSIYAQEIPPPEQVTASVSPPPVSPIVAIPTSPTPATTSGQVLQAATGPTIPVPGPGEPNWVFDTEVTQVGRNAERARQFVYWVVTHSPIYNVPQIYQAYFFVQRITWILVVFVIIGLAVQLVLTRRSIGPTFSGISIGMDRITIASIVIRMVLILSFVFFSYNIILGMIQVSDAMSNFFISRLGGEDLFNIVFSSSNNEANYDFIGYKNADPLEQDMVSTSLLLVRSTSFTYNFMGIILILRHVVLIFLLILSPILALILPFIFVRNVGSIWIGEFFRWLFYGPLFSLFIAALARVWKGGIPYQFNFSEAGTKMVYQTGVNILYGGPAQVLSPTNTSNYVDTYAEYIIALVMLWAAIMLPWLLLRIFRDYCCDILERNQGVLMQILDKMRGIVPPAPGPQPSKPGPVGTFGKTMRLPESRPVATREIMTRERIVEKIRDRQMSNIETHDITRAYDLRVSSLRDIARIETNKQQRTTMRETLSQIQNPLRAANPQARTQYESLRNEFMSRANQGDKLARQVIQAATPRASHLEGVTAKVSPEQLKQAVNAPGQPVVLAGMRVANTKTVTSQTIDSVSEKTQTEKKTVEEILKSLPVNQIVEEEKVKALSTRIHVSEEHIKKVVEETQKELDSQSTSKVSADTIREVAQKTHLDQKSIEQVLEEVPAVSSMASEEAQIGAISEKTGTSPDNVKKILEATPKDDMPQPTAPVPNVSIEEYEEIRTMWMNHYRNTEIPASETIKSREDWINEDIKQLTNTIDLLISPSSKDRQEGMQKVSDLLPFLLLGGFTDIETLTYIKAKLEAAKLVQEEVKRVDEAKTQAKQEQEDMLVIPAIEPQEEEKTMQTEQTMEMPVPDEVKSTDEEKSPETVTLPGFHEEDDELDDKLPFRKINTVPTGDPKK